MAPRIKAVTTYRPRIEQGNTVQKPELVRAMSRATGLVEGTIELAIKELRDQILEFSRLGHAVKVDGLGTFAPSIDLDGKITISYRPDTFLNRGLNTPGIFSGTVLNNENIGKTSEELVTLWNSANPDDPIASDSVAA
jgi:hypothetical protein